MTVFSFLFCMIILTLSTVNVWKKWSKHKISKRYEDTQRGRQIIRWYNFTKLIRQCCVSLADGKGIWKGVGAGALRGAGLLQPERLGETFNLENSRFFPMECIHVKAHLYLVHYSLGEAPN